MSTKPDSFTIRPIPPEGGFAIDRGGRTVAIVTAQGYIDWLLPDERADGPRFDQIEIESHLCYVLGVKLLLFPPHMHPAYPKGTERNLRVTHHCDPDGQSVTLTGISRSDDGIIHARVTAVLTLTASGEYRWHVDHHVENRGESEADVQWLEFNNIYPGRTGRCFLFAADKRYTHTLATDASGVSWGFPHQHTMHYGYKLRELDFAVGTTAGFFGHHERGVVVEVTRSDLPPDWNICDMYYDLHCGARTGGRLDAGQKAGYAFDLEFLSLAETRSRLDAARPVPVTPKDREAHTYPSLQLGLNRMTDAACIDDVDDASYFRVHPPSRVWEPSGGPGGSGALKLTHDGSDPPLRWEAEPPTQVPADSRLQVRGKVQADVTRGNGVQVRLRCGRFVWRPTPKMVWKQTLATPAVTQTHGDWVQVTTPVLEMDPTEKDWVLWIDVLLDGKGEARVSDLDVDMTAEHLDLDHLTVATTTAHAPA